MKWASCLPKWGNVLAHHGQRACPCWADLLSGVCPISWCCNTHIPIFRILPTHAIPAVWIIQSWHSPIWQFLTSDDSSHLTIPFISKPSRQLADNRQAANYLSVRILQQKTRQSDSFSAILGFTENQRYSAVSKQFRKWKNLHVFRVHSGGISTFLLFLQRGT